MKKKYISYGIFLLIMQIGVFTSCYDDKSKNPSREVIGIVIDTVGCGEILEYQYGSEMTLERAVEKPGIANPDLSYEWKINIGSSQDTASFAVLSRDRIFKGKLSNSPSPDPYLLVYTVTDNETGLKYYATWKILVVSGLGEGLVVADTRDDATSNLSHIQAKGVTSGYEGKNIITRDLYFVSNEVTIDGLVKNINYSTAAVQTDAGRVVENRLYISTNKSIFTVDPSTFKLTHPAEDLFYVAQNSYVPSSIGYGSHNALYLVINGKLFIYSRQATIGGKFGSAENYLDNNYVLGKYWVAEAAMYPQCGLSFYDETNGRFGYKFSSMAFNPLSVVGTNEVFNGGNVRGFECKGAGLANGLEHIHLLQNKTTNAYFLYRLGKDDNNAIVPKSLIEVTSCRDIGNAITYVFCSNQDVMYYATAKHLYSALLSASGASVTEQNVVDLEENEEITGLQMFYQTNFAMCWETATNVMPQNGMQLMLSTYNKVTEEGKIYLIPIPALNSGRLGSPTNTFEGFGRILAIGTQTR